MSDPRMRQLAEMLNQGQIPNGINVGNFGAQRNAALRREQEMEQQLIDQRMQEEEAMRAAMPPSAPPSQQPSIQDYVGAMQAQDPQAPPPMFPPIEKPQPLLANVPGISGLVQALMGVRAKPPADVEATDTRLLNIVGDMGKNNMRIRMANEQRAFDAAPARRPY